MTKRDEDNARFYADLTHETSLVVVVKAAIHLELETNKLIRSLVVDPNQYDKIDMTYNQRVQLAVAMGMQPRLLGPLQALGRIRNRFAHELRLEISKSDADGFYKSFAPVDSR